MFYSYICLEFRIILLSAVIIFLKCSTSINKGVDKFVALVDKIECQ